MVAVTSPRSLLGKTLNVLSFCSIRTGTRNQRCMLATAHDVPPSPSLALLMTCASYSSFRLVFWVFPLQS